MAARKPNLIVSWPDQQRADTLACYGGKKVYAPNLNKLASESVVFERAYVTHPVCSPSRSSLMTGTWPHTNGYNRNSVPLDRRFRTFPELMRTRIITPHIWGSGILAKKAWSGGDFRNGFPPSPAVTIP